MTPSLFTALLFALIIIIMVATSLKIAQENEQFAEFVMGRFAGFKGPGLLFRLLTSKMHLLKVGDVGMVIDRKTGIGAVLLMQYLPFYDADAITTLLGFEQRIYENQ